MNEHDLSDGQWKVAVVLTVALLGWLCFNSSGYVGAQRRVTNLEQAPHATNSLQAHVAGRIVSPDIKKVRAFYGPLGEIDTQGSTPEVPVVEATITSPRTN